ncbi:MAG: UDP-3-O-(3-hydroxymyristoyl)glucosamine N-acyltransferase, partial [Rhodobacteraceae bacterium]|nr:UDP-3-O-(3-hydroxymyristoyl)glucosamine N-acyltransferase [Paracoccaceae bacterium]
GAGTRIASHCSIGPNVRIGARTVILAGVRIMRRVAIGDRVILHPGVVLGGDGFSFVTAEESNVERARSTLGAAEIVVPSDATQHRIHSLGGVVIGDDVEIGSNTTVDAGTIRPTQIGRGCKLDNLCHIGHNVVIGEDCLLAGMCAVAGSARLGDRVVLGGKAGIGDNITVGNDSVITGASSVLSNVPAGRVMMGYPATKIDVQVESYKALRRLPRLIRELGNRQNSVSKPE